MKSSLNVVCLTVAVTMALATDIPRYCLPGRPCWPSAEKIERFSKKITGEVLQPGDAGYANYSKMNDAFFDRMPAIIVLVASKYDVVRAILFAKHYNIRLTIFSCGHDFAGRSTANGSLQINFRKKKDIKVNLDDQKSRTGASVTIDSGANWGEVYEEVDKYNKQIIGGFCTSVCVAGLTMGGGAGVISRSFGLAVDNVMEFTIVLESGIIATCSPRGTCFQTNGREYCENADLFWAVRGGGGGTYGIVLSFTFVLHDPPTGLVNYRAQYPNDISGNTTIGQNILEFLLAFLPTIPNTWGGSVLLGPAQSPSLSYRTTITIYMILNAPWSSPDLDAIQPLVKFRSSDQLFSEFQNFTSLLEYQRTANHPAHVRMVNTNAHYKSRQDNTDMARYLSEYVVTANVKGTVAGCTVAQMGGQITQPPTHKAAISKDFRSTDFSVTVSQSWVTPALDQQIIANFRRLDVAIAKIINSSYVNEAFFEAVDWSYRFWGENYCRLQRIKYRYDRRQFFYCHQCVTPFQCKQSNTGRDTGSSFGHFKLLGPIMGFLLLKTVNIIFEE